MKINNLTKSASWKRSPTFIKSQKVWKSIKHIEKPFPEMGLNNCYEKCDTDFDDKPAYIGFSSVNVKGFWDLVTMSMRGVCSCMHWNNKHAKSLIGSVTDPFLGIVYISDGSRTKYGVRFTRRALVRLVYNGYQQKYQLLLERVYKDTGNTNPEVYHNHDDGRTNTRQVFIDFLSRKTNNKYDIVSYPTQRTIVPRPTSLDHIEFNVWSMSDSGVTYDRLNDDFVKKFTQQN